MVTIKICGLSEETGLRAAIDAGADFIGFVHFPKSPRHVSLARAAQLQKLLPEHVASVLVVVSPDDALLAEIAATLCPSYLQLHGKETPARVAQIRTQYPKQKLIKALSVSTGDDLSTATSFKPLVDMLLFDAKPPIPNPQSPVPLPGGNGISFDWSILQGFESQIPWMLSGGLTVENVAQAIRESGAKMVDVSSGVESQAGVKDAGKIRAFIKAAKL